MSRSRLFGTGSLSRTLAVFVAFSCAAATLLAMTSPIAQAMPAPPGQQVGAWSSPSGKTAGNGHPHAGKVHKFPGISPKATPQYEPHGKGRTEMHYTACTDAVPCGSGNLIYNGGAVQESPVAFLIFWGSSWSSGSPATNRQIVTNYFRDMGTTGFENTDTQYHDTFQGIQNTLMFGGAWVDMSTPPTETTNCSNIDTGLPQPAIDDSSYVAEVQAAIAANGWPDDPNNATYFVYTPSGDAAYDSYIGCSTLGAYSNSSNSFCAYHGYSSGSLSYAYGVMPWPDHDGVLGYSYCPAMETPNGNSVGDTLSNLSSHEQTEAITDPQVGSGWVDSSGYEIGDKCAWIDNGNTTLNNGGAFSLQPEYSNNGATCLNFSRSWYFAEGYTGGNFTEYLTLANPTANTANVTVEYLLGGGVSPITAMYTVNPNSRKTINVNNAIISSTSKNVSMVVFADQPIVAERPMYFTYKLSGTTTAVPGGTDVLGANQLGVNFYFGYLDTSPNHDTYLTVLNPNPASTYVVVTYYAASNGAVTDQIYTVNGNSRGTIYVDSAGLPAGSYSASVGLTRPGMVERPMYLVDSVTGQTGAADVVGVAAVSSTWNFAEGYTGTGFSERYLVSNMGGTSTTATVTFYRKNGTTATANLSLNPGQQGVVDANAVLGSGVNNSATVTSPGTIVAERFMSFDYTGAVGGASSSNIPGATDVIGTPSTATSYQFAEGYTGTGFAEYLTLENPGGTPATVTVTYLPQSGGSPTTVAYPVGAQTRATINTSSVMPNQSFSLALSSTQPIVTERPMYFAYNGTQTGGSDVIGYVPNSVN